MMQKRAVILLLLLSFQFPSPPIPTWTAPGVLEVRFQTGDCLWYTRPGGLDTFIGCESPVLLGRGGDGAYVPEEEGVLTSQNKDGVFSSPVPVPPNPFRYEMILPLIAMGP